MNIKQAKQLIKLCVKADTPALIVGHSGVGKSQVVLQLGEELGYRVVTKMLSQVEAAELGGIPYRDPGDNKMHYSKPHWIPDDEPVLLFLDELNQCQRDVESAAFDLVLNREVNGHKLPAGSKVIAAINPNISIYTTTNQLSDALIKRFVVIPFQPTEGEFLDWGKDKLHPTLHAFFKSNSKAIGIKDLDMQINIEPCPRTNAMASALLKAAELDDPSALDSVELVSNILRGTVGIQTAAEFISFQTSQKKPLTFKQISTNYDKHREHFTSAREELRGDLVAVTVQNFSEGLEEYVQASAKDFKYTTHVAHVDSEDVQERTKAIEELNLNVKENLDTKKMDNMIKFLNDLPDDLLYSMVKRFLEYCPVKKGMTTEEGSRSINSHHTMVEYLFGDIINTENNMWKRLHKDSKRIEQFLSGIEAEANKK